MAISLFKDAVQHASRPLINAHTYGQWKRKNQGMTMTSTRKKLFWEWFRSRPELNSPVFIRVNDTISEVEFVAPDGSPLGRNKRIEAENWYEMNMIDERLKSIWSDSIMTGSGFGWKGKISQGQLKELIKNYFSSMNIKSKELIEHSLKAMDEDLRKPRIFDYVASSTMEIIHDEVEVLGFEQTVGTNVVRYTPEEIVHFAFSRLDGRVEGYTPIASLGPEMDLLWFIKENMKAYMRNQGLPRKVFSFPDEMANSKNHQHLIEQLETYGAVENRHGNLVLTGKVDVLDLEEKMRDMEYETLALLITSNIAYALHMPVSRIPYLIGKAQSAGDAGGLADSGYWSLIESDRRKIENLMYFQVTKPMGFRMRFKRKTTVENLREVQNWSMKADAVTKVDSVLAKFGKKLKDEKLFSLLGLQMEDVEKAPEQAMNGIEKTGLRNQNMLNNQDLGKDHTSLRQSNARAEANNNPKGLAKDGN
jgi:hypothetical protein